MQNNVVKSEQQHDFLTRITVLMPETDVVDNPASKLVHQPARLPKSPNFEKNDIRGTKRFKEHILLSSYQNGTDISTYGRCS